MSTTYKVTASYTLGRSRVGLRDLHTQPLDADGNPLGVPIASGFKEQGLGMYTWTGWVPAGSVHGLCSSAGTPGIGDVAPLRVGSVDQDLVNLADTVTATSTVVTLINARLPTHPASREDIENQVRGADPCTWRIVIGDKGISDVDVWVTLTNDPDAPAEDRKRTNTEGYARFFLDKYASDGITPILYYGWAQKAGVVSVEAEELYCD